MLVNKAMSRVNPDMLPSSAAFKRLRCTAYIKKNRKDFLCGFPSGDKCLVHLIYIIELLFVYLQFIFLSFLIVNGDQQVVCILEVCSFILF